ncbi:Probable multidrug resistance-associated protein lethal(2)03659 [Gryllus bimaculatus]|nr:Probable multidrug resistance-associated protein lethal(2)03659 [Gryllus bimaculatus]
MGEKTSKYLQQLKAILIRNILLKKREKRKTLAEILVPCTLLALMIVIKLAAPTPHYPAITVPREDTKLADYFLQNISIAVVPNTTGVQMFLNKSNELLEEMMKHDIHHQPIEFVFYESEDALLKVYWTTPSSIQLAVIFDNDDPCSKELSYGIRTNPSLKVPSTQDHLSSKISCRLKTSHWKGMFPLEAGDTCPVNQYFHSGFIGMQALLDYTKMRIEKPGYSIQIPEFSLQLFPKEPYTADWLYSLRLLVPYYMMVAFSQFMYYLLLLIVGEKEKKIIEGMKIMGLRDSVFWLSWFIIYGLFVLVIAVVAIILIASLEVFKHSNLFLIFILIYLFSLTIVMMAFMIAPFFSKGRTAGVVGGFAVYGMGALYYLQVYLENMDPVYLWLMSLISTTGFGMAVDKALMLDIAGHGVHLNNLWSGPGMPFGGSIIMMLVDIIGYGLLAYYLDSVIPSEYGVKQYPWFCFTKSYWCPKKTIRRIPTLNGESGSLNANDDNAQDVEPVTHEMKGREAIRIVDLEKTFRKCCRMKHVKAVDGINLTIYEGQITAILGHNGAGKTTVFNMLTGLTYPTSGTAYTFGYDIRSPSDMYAIRSMTGVCPQQDILFDVLTPQEHLEFYAAVKGVPPSLMKYEVTRMLDEVGLSDQANTFAMKLSGGQKRKLSVGIALIGDPKIIILDEPTAGVDPYSRRYLWSLLQNRRHGKVILLTTHFMDEADILADRKAIISKGRLRCCGSSLFLKNKFGIGYHLTMVLDGVAREQAIVQMVTSHVTQAEKARRHGRELSFILPHNAVNRFPTLFEAIEQEIALKTLRLGICSYGVAMTTLEEVFLQLELDEEEGEESDNTIDNISKKMVRNRALSRSLSLQSKSTSYQSLQNEGAVLTPGSLPDGSIKPEREARGTTQQNVIGSGAAPPAPGQPDGVPLVVSAQQAVKGLALEQITLQPSPYQTLAALVKIRVLRTIRDWRKVAAQLLLPFIITWVMMQYMDDWKRATETLPSLTLNSSVYERNAHMLVHNGTGYNVDGLVSTLQAESPLPLMMYDGNFSRLLSLQPHMAAFNVNALHVPQVNVTLIYNDTMHHSLPIAINLFSNAYYSMILDGSNIPRIKVRSHPFEKTSLKQLRSSPVIIAFGMAYAFVISCSLFVTDLVYDREIHAKNQLRVNGLTFSMYFVSYFVVIGSLICLSFGGFLLALWLHGADSLLNTAALSVLIVLFLFCIVDLMLFIACCTYIFDKMETAQGFLANGMCPVGCVPFALVVIVDYLLQSPYSAYCLHFFFSFFCSPYIPFSIIYYVDSVYYICKVNSSCHHPVLASYMTDEIIVILTSCILHIPLWYLLLVILDVHSTGGKASDVFRCLLPKLVIESSGEENTDVDEHEDDDVRTEREKVAGLQVTSPPEPPVVVVRNLRKEYKVDATGDGCSSACCTRESETEESTKVVVRNLSLSVEAGEVFGLLGHNGAGKTTTMKILIAEEAATKGKVQIAGHTVTSSLGKAFMVLGYCPQFDAQWKDITIREHLECYCAIRGVSRKDIPRVVESYLGGLQIQEHAGKLTQHCSGGTRRKLSFAMAMAGDPRIVLLDEPSTGMDPRSKRFLWDTILASFQGTRGAILTTHSMEEADALCSRVAIMVGGSLRCIGSTQHLKNRYGAGYRLEMKLKGGDRTPTTPSSDHSKDLKEFVKHQFKNSSLDESFADRLVFSVPQSSVTSLAQCFKQLEKAKMDLDIEEYSFSQTTLEQVFLKFAH